MAGFVSPDRRVCLAASPPLSAAPQLEAVFVGAAPLSPAYDDATDALAAAAQLGFVPESGDQTLTFLPLAFSSAAAFNAAFPGDTSWLAQSVADFFNAGGSRAWVVRIDLDPAAPLAATLRAAAPLLNGPPLTGVDIAVQVPSAGLLLLPDIEYLCLASATPPPAAPAAPPPPAAFRPIADFVTPAALPPSLPRGAAPVSAKDVLAQVSIVLAASRPDMLCLFALPAGTDPTQSTADVLAQIILAAHPNGQDLRQVQLFAPLLRNFTGTVARSPSGLVAGLLCANAEGEGVWRSLAGRPLPFAGTPWRRFESNALDALRRAGIATLRFAPGGTVLDDDILAVADQPGTALQRAAGTRRLVGWLLRNLQAFGEQLVFENVLDDGRVELALTSLFATLLKRGALNGKQITDAVQITRRNTGQQGVMQFDIAIAFAAAIETLRLTFDDGEVTASLGLAA
jgi:hypothetical protein